VAAGETALAIAMEGAGGQQDEILTVSQAAAFLGPGYGVSRLYHDWKRLSLGEKQGGRLVFRRKRLERFQRAQRDSRQ
jgi:hypothetical protein